MRILKKLFTINDGYNEEIKKYTVIDVLIAILLYVGYFFAMIVCGAIDKFALMDGMPRNLLGMAINILFVLITICLIKLRNQSIETVGLIGGRVKLGFLLGGILALILFTCNCVLNIAFGDAKLADGEIIILLLFEYLFVGAAEEIIFRGFIMSRIYPIFRNNIACVIVTGLLFVALHFPYRLMVGMTFPGLITNYRYLADLFITHCVFSYIYLKSKSLYSTILPHWMSNFAHGILIF